MPETKRYELKILRRKWVQESIRWGTLLGAFLLGFLFTFLTFGGGVT